MCTHIDDAIAVAALIQAIVAKLIRLRNQNQSWRIYRGVYIDENKWRAVRYGIDGNLIDFGIESEVPMRQLATELLELVDDVVDDLGSRQEVERIMHIFERVPAQTGNLPSITARWTRKSNREALFDVVDHLIGNGLRRW